MQRRITPAALVLTALVALTGCGAGTGSGTAAASPATAETQSATPTLAKTYSNEDLTALISALKDSEGRPLTVVPSAQIDQGIIKSKELLKSAVFTPTACKVLADSNSQLPENSTYAAGSTMSAADKAATVVTVIALQDAQTMTAQLKAARSAATQCQTFTIEAAGQKITTETTPVGAATAGDESFAALAKQSLGTGAEQTVLTVTGVRGNLAATAVKVGPAVTEEASAELIQLINAILAHG
ncbi:hypothetical protein [Arthrobacter sp. UYCu712]|uniref:hypothetical protein n=1 Tax=Arthrobacter sp. UYCu712 TaxID=3156340 RepID=UPI003397DE4B